MLNALLYNLYKIENKYLRHKIISTINAIEGGEVFSKTLRRIFLDYHHIQIGMYSYGCFSVDNLPEDTIIGRYCSFANNVKVLNGNHPMLFKSLHPFFYNPVFNYVDQLLIKHTKLVIGHDVWIGHNATILPSVSLINTGAVIGAGTIVTHDIPPYAVVVGNPGKITRYRFHQKTIEKLIQSEWWNKDIDGIKKNETEFMTFVKAFE